MIMTDSTQSDLLSEVAYNVITQIAPHELPIFQAVYEAYFDDPKKALTGLKSEDAILGFGFDPSIALLTPIVLAVVSEVLQFVVQIGKKGVEDAFGSEISETIKGMLNKGDHVRHSHLSDKEIRLAYEKAFTTAKSFKLSDAKAAALANSRIAQFGTVT